MSRRLLMGGCSPCNLIYSPRPLAWGLPPRRPAYRGSGRCWEQCSNWCDTWGPHSALARATVSLAALQGWAGPLWEVGLFLALESSRTSCSETICRGGRNLICGAARVRPRSGAWLWGPLGLLHGHAADGVLCREIGMRGLEMIQANSSNTPASRRKVCGYTQRLLAGEGGRASSKRQPSLRTVCTRRAAAAGNPIYGKTRP